MSGPVIALEASQHDRAAQILTRAFYQDPVYTHIFPDPDRRARTLQSLWAGVVRYSRAYGVVHTTPTVQGVACWVSPGNVELTLWRTLRTGLALQLPWLLLRLPSQTRRRFLNVLDHIDGARRRLIQEPYWYLWAIGVDPAYQGQGIGGRLLRPLLARSAADGLPCYLETQNEQNVEFYQRRGFRVLSVEQVPGHGIRYWTMLRQPGG